jgi:hypothetical protein
VYGVYLRQQPTLRAGSGVFGILHMLLLFSATPQAKPSGNSSAAYRTCAPGCCCS